MKHKIKNPLYILNDLSGREREDFCHKLFDLNKKVFGNLTEEDFPHFITECGSEKSYIMVYKNSKDEFVGYFTKHLFKNVVGGKEAFVFRSQTGLIQEYRRTKVNMYFVLFVILKYRLMYPFKTIYCFLPVISPSMYAVLAKNLGIVFPKIGMKQNDSLKLEITELKKIYDFKEGDNFWVSHVDLVSLASEKELDYWKKSENPHIRFYIDTNPDFQEGNRPFPHEKFLKNIMINYSYSKAFWKFRESLIESTAPVLTRSSFGLSYSF